MDILWNEWPGLNKTMIVTWVYAYTNAFAITKDGDGGPDVTAVYCHKLN